MSRVMVLLQSAGSRVPTKCSSEDLKQSEIPEREIGRVMGRQHGLTESDY